MSRVIEEAFRQARGSSLARLAPFSSAHFSAADAMFAPVVNRLHVYDVPVTPATRAYMDAMMALPAWQEWQAQARSGTLDRSTNMKSLN